MAVEGFGKKTRTQPLPPEKKRRALHTDVYYMYIIIIYIYITTSFWSDVTIIHPDVYILWKGR